MFDKKIIVLFFLVVGSVLFMLISFSCDEENPITASDEITLTVITNDESGQIVENANITLTNVDKKTSEKGKSDSKGFCNFNLKDVKCDVGDKFTLSVKPPIDGDITGECLFDNLILTCCDTLIVCDKLSRNIIVTDCDSSNYETDMDFNLCFEDGSTLTRKSKIFKNYMSDSCSWTVSSNSTLPSYLSISPNPAGGALTIPAGRDLQFEIIFNPQGKREKYDGVYKFTAKCGSETCVNGNINISAFSDTCNNCPCTENIKGIKKFKESVCFEEVRAYGIVFDHILDLDTLITDTDTMYLRNKFDNCKWYFKAITNSLSNSLDLISEDFEIDKYSNRFYNLKINFQPEQAKIYNELLIFELYKDRGFGPEKCYDSLIINLEYEATDIDCNDIKITSEITPTITGCVGAYGDYKVTITNDGECPEEVECRITGVDESSFYFYNFNSASYNKTFSRTVIPEKSGKNPGMIEFGIGFNPEKKKVWPFGRPDQRNLKMNFSATLEIEFDHCPQKNYPLNGVPDTTCGDTDASLTIWGDADSKAGIMFVPVDFKLSLESQKAKSLLHLYVESVDNAIPTSPSVKIANGIDGFGSGGGLYYFGPGPKPQALCPMVTFIDNITYDICNGNSWNQSIDLKQGDYFIIKINGECILGWVESIKLSNTLNPYWIIHFKFCINYELE